MKILGIETSCDETAAAVAEFDDGAGARILSNAVYSQIDIHKKWGGVVPEVAAREHAVKIIPVIDEALAKIPSPPAPLQGWSGEKKYQVDAIAVAVGPGLITSLMVGVETAKALSYAWKLPLIAVNHIEAHIYANFINANPQSDTLKPNRIPDLEFPAVVLTVSGGHTMLILMRGHGEMETIGETRDDAAGEAFDKGAKLMGLGYPGGPAIAAEAAKLTISNSQLKIQLNKNNYDIKLPRPMMDSPNFDFSFSGLKTALRYALEKDDGWKKRIPEYCREYQQAIIDVLLHKTFRAAKKYGAKTVMLSGGVVANKELRRQFIERIEKELPSVKYSIPEIPYTTDNAAMVAVAGGYKAINKKFIAWQDLNTDCNLEL